MSTSATGSLSSIQQSTTDTSRSGLARKGLADNFDNFLLLLTTQLKNQDPTKPLDTNEFTQQLVSFTGVEQAINTNTNLEKLISMTQSTQLNDAVNYLGKIVEATGNSTRLENGQAQFFYTLQDNAQIATVQVKNNFGQVVYSADGETLAGKHEFLWDGKDDSGNQLPDGKYSIDIQALDADGKIMDVTTSVSDVVTGITMEDGQPLLTLGEDGATVTPDKVQSVRFRDFL